MILFGFTLTILTVLCFVEASSQYWPSYRPYWPSSRQHEAIRPSWGHRPSFRQEESVVLVANEVTENKNADNEVAGNEVAEIEGQLNEVEENEGPGIIAVESEEAQNLEADILSRYRQDPYRYQHPLRWEIPLRRQNPYSWRKSLRRREPFRQEVPENEGAEIIVGENEVPQNEVDEEEEAENEAANILVAENEVAEIEGPLNEVEENEGPGIIAVENEVSQNLGADILSRYRQDTYRYQHPLRWEFPLRRREPFRQEVPENEGAEIIVAENEVPQNEVDEEEEVANEAANILVAEIEGPLNEVEENQGPGIIAEENEVANNLEADIISSYRQDPYRYNHPLRWEIP